MSLPQPQADRMIALHGRSSSLVLECPENGAALWRYWGPRLADNFSSGPGLIDWREPPSFSLNEPVPFTVFPSFGLGWFGQSALLAHRDGCDFAHGFDHTTIEWIEPGKSLCLSLTDSVTNIEVCVSIAMDPDCDVVTLSTKLLNTGDAVLDVQWLAAASLPLPDDTHHVHSFTGRHNVEFTPQVEPLGRAMWRKENRHGLTSHDSFPGAVVTTENGAAYGAQLAWSGNSAQCIEAIDDGRYQWQFGEWLAPGEIRLAPGQALESPELLATCSSLGPNGVASNFHAAIRKRMTWPDGQMQPRPVILNTWEGFYFNHDEAALMRLADAAAEIGVERFVLDDGWFHRRNNDMSSLGDWWVDDRKYPNGLGPLAQHVTGHGMQFGLWVEPEMINPDSETFRAHPDWALQLSGRPLATARNQLVLDLSRAKVRDFLFAKIGALINDLPISYLKWDHNRDLAAAGGPEGRSCYHDQVLAAFNLFARFRSAFPHVEIESCAGGGGRIDAGIIRHTHRFWTSDCTDALSRIGMQPSFLQYMPPELMGAHVATVPNHGTGRTQSLDFRAAVALQGHFGVELNILKLESAEKQRLAAWIAFYKDWRHLLHDNVWTGKSADNLVWHAAGSADEWLCIIYRLDQMGLRHMPPVRLPFVTDGKYQVRAIGPAGYKGDDMAFDASWITNHGLPVPHMKAESAIIYNGRRI